MADNINVTPGTGATVRADEVGATLIQVVKLALGADGVEDLLLDSGQQTKAASLPVTLASDQDAIPVTGTITAVTAITNALPAGTNAIGKLAANSGVDIGDVDVTSIAAGENHLGAVGGHTAVIIVTPTLTTHATYAANDFVGTDATPMEFAGCARINAGHGRIVGAALIDYALQSIACELWLFATTVTPPADSAAWTIFDADALKCVGVIDLTTYRASALNSISQGEHSYLPMPFKCGAGSTSLFGCLVTRGAPTYASGDVSIRLTVVQD